jgi:hypothetical protein
LNGCKFFVNALLAGFSVFLTSCSLDGVSGSLQRNALVTQSFQQTELSPTYNYYYFGSYHAPDAVIGIDETWIVRSKFWRPVALNEGLLASVLSSLICWLASMRPLSRLAGNQNYGVNI